MSWNHGEVTVVPYELKKPSWGGEYWVKSWEANYKGEDFWIKKAPKGHYDYDSGYDVSFKWKGRHPRNVMGVVTPKLIGLKKLKTMPQVKKLIRAFVDDMKAGKIVCGDTGVPLTMNYMAGCVNCSIYNEWDMSNLGLYHRKNMYHHKRLDDGSDKFPKTYCKWHTKLNVIDKYREDGQLTISETDIWDYRRKKENFIKRGNRIDVDAIVPDSELVPMFNPYLEMVKRRKGMEAEESKFNPLLIAAGLVTLISYLKS